MATNVVATETHHADAASATGMFARAFGTHVLWSQTRCGPTTGGRKSAEVDWLGTYDDNDDILPFSVGMYICALGTTISGRTSTWDSRLMWPYSS